MYRDDLEDTKLQCIFRNGNFDPKTQRPGHGDTNWTMLADSKLFSQPSTKQRNITLANQWPSILVCLFILDIFIYKVLSFYIFRLMEFDEPNSDTRDCVVLLLGWYGAHIKQLLRYSRMLTNEGYHVVRTVMPATAVLGFEFQQRKFAQRLLSSVVEYFHQKGKSKPIHVVVYCFSNGGALVYDKMLRDPNRSSDIKIKGAILDSAPGTICFSKGYLAFLATRPPLWLFVAAHLFGLVLLALPPLGLFKLFRYVTLQRSQFPFIPLALTIATIAVIHFLILNAQQRQNERYWNSLRFNNLPHPELYLYSTEDKLCPAVDIDKLIKNREKDGMPIYSRKFNNSGHVRHYIDNPKVYRDTVIQFLQNL